MELSLLAASLKSRDDYELIRSYIDFKGSGHSYSKQFQIVIGKIDDYYRRDPDAQFVQVDLLTAQIAESIRNDKHVERFKEMLIEAVSQPNSEVNVRAMILMAKQQEIGDRLAVALTGGDEGKVRDLLSEYKQIADMTDLSQLVESGTEVLEGIDLEELFAVENDPASLIKVAPVPLNDRLDGGAKRGHHIVVFGPVESGKSLTAINMSCGFARQNFKGLYFINEDRPQDIIMRKVSNLSGMTKYEIMQNPKKAKHLAMENGYGNITVIGCSPGTPAQFRDCIEKYDPTWVVYDQLRNIKVKAENRTNQLERAATEVRNITKETHTLGVSVTQAGDSASGKLVLETGDVDSSNVGIPAQADVMVGVGFDAQFEAEGLRNLSLPKNKISGRHENFPVRIIPQLSRLRPV